jgi:hypothetical protein
MRICKEVVGDGTATVLMQMARLGKQDLELDGKVVQSVALINEIGQQISSFR